MRSPFRVIRDVPVERDRDGHLHPWPGYQDVPADASFDVVPLEDVAGLRRKATAWDYAVHRGFLGSSKVVAAIDFAKLGEAETLDVKPGDVVLFRTPDLGTDQIEDLRRTLSEVFPDNRVVVLMGDTGGVEVRSEAKARELPGVGRALDSIESSS